MAVCDVEFKLAKELKALCEPYGKKWIEKESKESAKILHKLGLLYHKNACAKAPPRSSEQKRKFIQSAALLNCALVRQPTEAEQIRSDLLSLCSDIIRCAGGVQTVCNLVDYAKTLKEEVEKWRQSLKEEVNRIPHIQDERCEQDLKDLEDKKIKVTEIYQNEITEKYKSFMRQVSHFAFEVLGKRPSSFALVGMGSMARKEITPYSDFENIILLKDEVQFEKDYEDVLEFFRWYAVIFQVIIINMGETILPSVNIPSLNDSNTKNGDWFYDAHTKRGISLDGMMPHACKSPLGRPATENKPFPMELIKTVSEMANLVTKEEDLKNGYHLADILTNTCFVDGSEEIHKVFIEKVQNCSTNVQNQNDSTLSAMIKEDLHNHSTKLGISSTINNDSYNVKQFVYRSTTIFITGIAKLHKVPPGSCFEIIRKMRENNLTSETFSRKLQYAVAVGCEIRLKAYLTAGQQNDFIHTSLDGTEEDISSSLVKAVGKKSCYDYFEIACCLQYDTMEVFNFKYDTSYMYYHPVTMCITISSFLHMYDRIIDAWHFVRNNPILEDRPNLSDINTDDDDEFENDVCDSELVETDDDDTNAERMVYAGDEFDNSFDDGSIAVDVFEYADKTEGDRLSCKVVTHPENASSNNATDAHSANNCVVENADGKRHLTTNKIAKSDNVLADGECQTNVEKIDNDDQRLVFSGETGGKFATCKHNGSTFIQFGNNTAGSGDICVQTHASAFDTKDDGADCQLKSAERNDSYYNIDSTGGNKAHTNDKSLEIERAVKSPATVKTNSVEVETLLGSWHERMQDFNCKIVRSASSLPEKSKLDLVSSKNDELGKAIDVLIYFGKYFRDKAVYLEALDYLRISLKLLKNSENKAKDDYNQLQCLFWIGKCNMGIKEFLTAVDNFQKILELKSSYSVLELQKKQEVQSLEWNCVKELATSQYTLNRFEEACKNFQKAFDGYHSLNMVDDASFCLGKLGYCFFYKMINFQEASFVFQRLLNYFEASFDESSAKYLETKAVCHFHLGRCKLKLQRYEEAKLHIKAAIKLCQSSNIEQYEEKKLTARCLFFKGIAEQKTNKDEKAFNSFSKSLELLKNLCDVFGFEQHSIFMALCHENIALCHFRQKHSQLVIHHRKEALKIFELEKNRDNNIRNVLRLNQRLGDIYKMLRKCDVAYDYYNTALSIHLELCEESHSITSAWLYRACGVCLKRLGKCQNAQQYLKKSVEISLQCLLTGNTDKPYIWREVGMCYWDLCDYRQARESFEKYLKRLQLLDDSTEQTKYHLACVLQRISWCFQKDKNWEEAFKYCRQSLEKFRLLDKTPNYDFKIASLLDDIGVHFLCRNKIDEAKKHFEEAKGLCKTLSQTPKVLDRLASCCEHIGKCCKKQMVYNEAIENFKEARSNFEKILAKPFYRLSEENLLFKMAQVSRNTGFCLRSSGLLLESNEHFNLALESLEKLPSKPNYIEERAFILKHIGINFKNLQNYQTATR